MNRETFRETLSQHYTDEIKQIYSRSQHWRGEDRTLDCKQLNIGLQKLQARATEDGFSVEQFEDLVKTALPEDWQNTEVCALGKAAA